MTYKEILYKNALDEINNIYEESKYNFKVDLFRSQDLITSTNSAQMSSKEWLVETLIPFISDFKYLNVDLTDILVMGSWYGLTGMILRQHINNDIKIWNVDSDPEAAHYCNSLQRNNSDFDNNVPITDDAMEYYFDRTDTFQLIINTSCEHMEQEDLQMVLNSKPANTMACFQSNNYTKEAEHINTHDSLDSFVESLNLASVYYKGSMEPSADFTRYMVIGV